MLKTLLRLILSAWHRLWVGWLKLLALPSRWIVALLGLARPEAAPPTDRPAPDAEAGSAQQPAAQAKAEPEPKPKPDVESELSAEPEPKPVTQPVARPDLATATVLGSPRVAPPATAVKALRAGQFIEGEFRAAAGQRGYKLYLPHADVPAPMPLVVMLHGCKQNPDDFAAGTRMNRLADRGSFLVLYPAQSRSANAFGCWNWFNRLDQQRDSGEPSIIAGMIRDVMARHAVDSRRVYVAGLSAGAAMALNLAHTHPELLAAAGIHSGLPYGVAQDMITAMGVMKRGPGKRAAAAQPDKNAEAGVPLIVFHGDHDKTVHPLNGEQVIAQALGASLAAGEGAGMVVEHGQVAGGHRFTRTLHSNGTAPAHAEHWRVHDAGHAWSGGDPQGSFTDPLGPDASSEMLRFFLERTKA